MKKLLLAFLITIPLFCLSQEYSEVITVENKTTTQLYTSAREWFAETFNSANDVLQMDDPDAGKLIGKGSIHVSESYVAGKGLMATPVTLEWYPNFTIKVSIREGRYKCDISDISVRASAPVIGTVENPYQMYLDNLDYYKNGSDPQWLTGNPPQGVKVGKSYAKSAAQANKATHSMIIKTEEKIKALMNDLETAMKKENEDDW